jgi:putative ABC transport system permease protein
LVVAAVCGVIFATVGQSAAQQAQILARIDEAGTRTIIVRDSSGEAGLRAESVRSVERMSGVDWVLGFTHATDVANASLGTAGLPVPARVVYGTLPHQITFEGRPPASGEAMAGVHAIPTLGLVQPVGAVEGSDLAAPIVASFSANAPLSALERGVLVIADRAADWNTVALREMDVVAADVDDVEPLITSLRAVVIADSPDRLSIETPQLLVDLRAAVTTELAQSARQLLLLVLGVGLVVIMVTTAGMVSSRRRDFGRRRALGATRSAIIVLVLVQTAAAALVGVVVGSASGLLAVHQMTGALPVSSFAIGVVVLTLIMATVAGVPPAVLAAYRDPVRILRVP